MPAFAALKLSDGAATPVVHTFGPVNIDAAGIAKWADRSGGIALGFPVVTFSLRNPTKTSRVYKVSGKVVVPVLEVTSPSTSSGIQPAPTKAYDLTATVEMILPERSTPSQRADLIAFTKNFMVDQVMAAAVASFESVY